MNQYKYKKHCNWRLFQISLDKTCKRISEDNSTTSIYSKIYASKIDSAATDNSKPSFKMSYDPKACFSILVLKCMK